MSYKTVISQLQVQAMAKVILPVLLLVICHSSTHLLADHPIAARWVPPGAARQFVDAHNSARAEVGVDPLKWSYSLANAASRLVRYQKNYMHCEFADMTGQLQYGSNQMWSDYSAKPPREVVEYWVNSGKKHYRYTHNYCVRNQNCGPYKQVVWEKTEMVGCAQGVCGNNNGSLSICFYYPHPGNLGGQRPY
ncbi:hypothetical protein CsSME_00005766 [Camellia sinensis var. sinensis]|uniref:PR-1 like protein n=1 Tax=Camellia sinensis TaxID=4442 RepID=Q9ZNX5_CAMSI|nr:PR-1 like protein [Camellia sinensis]